MNVVAGGLSVTVGHRSVRSWMHCPRLIHCYRISSRPCGSSLTPHHALYSQHVRVVDDQQQTGYVAIKKSTCRLCKYGCKFQLHHESEPFRTSTSALRHVGSKFTLVASHAVLSPGESRWVCRRTGQNDRQTDASPLHYAFRTRSTECPYPNGRRERARASVTGIRTVCMAKRAIELLSNYFLQN